MLLPLHTIPYLATEYIFVSSLKQYHRCVVKATQLLHSNFFLDGLGNVHVYRRRVRLFGISGKLTLINVFQIFHLSGVEMYEIFISRQWLLEIQLIILLQYRSTRN